MLNPTKPQAVIHFTHHPSFSQSVKYYDPLCNTSVKFHLKLQGIHGTKDLRQVSLFCLL